MSAIKEMNKASYNAWKEKLTTQGKTPVDMVRFYRDIGMSEYAEELQNVILQMEGIAEAPAL